MELYKKIVNVEFFELIKTLDKGKDEISQLLIHQQANKYQKGTLMAVDDFKAAKISYDEVLLSGNYQDIQYYILEFDKCPEIMASGSFQVEIDFNGKELQNLNADYLLDPISFSLISNNNHGSAIFTWLNDNKSVNENFIRSLDKMNDGTIPHAIVRMIIEMFENIYFAPDWWENVPERTKILLIKRFRNYNRRINYSDDGVRIIDWSLINKISTLRLS